MSPLQRHVSDYLAMRRALGFTLERHARLLPNLVGYLEETGSATLSTTLALEWAVKPTGHPQEWAVRLSIARGFARYLQTLDEHAEAPPAGLLPRRRRRPAPYLYTEREIAALLDVTATLRFPFGRATHHTLFGLLAVTGMRVGEAIALDCEDVDFASGCMTVRAGKFGAARELPLHPSTLRALDAYRRLRDQRWPEPKAPAFFLSGAGTRLYYENVYKTFRGLVVRAGLTPRPGSGAPRIHSLRHSFAVGTLIDWYSSDVDVPAHMPRLSAYLGHAAPAGTYWYLQATPELLALAASRLEYAGGRS